MTIGLVLTMAAAGMQSSADAPPVPPTAAVAAKPAEPAEMLMLPAGTEIELMVLREVDSDRAKPGDPVKLRVNRPVAIGETVVIPVGVAAQGEVTASEKSGAVMQRGNLSVEITAITLGDRTIPLGTMLDQRGRGGDADDILKVALAPMWALFARGNAARLKAGERLTAELADSICFAPGDAGYLPAPCPSEAAPAEPAAAAET